MGVQILLGAFVGVAIATLCSAVYYFTSKFWLKMDEKRVMGDVYHEGKIENIYPNKPKDEDRIVTLQSDSEPKPEPKPEPALQYCVQHDGKWVDVSPYKESVNINVDVLLSRIKFRNCFRQDCLVTEEIANEIADLIGGKVFKVTSFTHKNSKVKIEDLAYEN